MNFLFKTTLAILLHPPAVIDLYLHFLWTLSHSTGKGQRCWPNLKKEKNNILTSNILCLYSLTLSHQTRSLQTSTKTCLTALTIKSTLNIWNACTKTFVPKLVLCKKQKAKPFEQMLYDICFPKDQGHLLFSYLKTKLLWPQMSSLCVN